MRIRKLTIVFSFIILGIIIAMSQKIVDNTKLRPWGSECIESITKSQDLQTAMLNSWSKSNNLAKNNYDNSKRIVSADTELSPSQVVDDGTRIYANIISWWNGDFIGLGAVRPVANTNIESVYKPSESSLFSGSGGGVFANGYFYKLAYGSSHGQVYNANFYALNMTTGEIEREINLPAQWYSIWENGAYNPADGKVYVLGYDGLARAYLSELNVETGVYTQLVSCSVGIMAMSFDKDGNLYALTGNGNLEKIDLNTGVGTVLFRVEDDGVGLNYWHSIAFDYHTGDLFWIRTDESFNSSLRLIDIENSTIKTVSELPALFGTNAACVVSPEAPDKAPSSVESIEVVFEENGSPAAIINTIAPKVAFDGSLLDGELILNLYVDDEYISSIKSLPGASCSFDQYVFESLGNHDIKIVVSNECGEGPYGKVIVYCGSDKPCPVEEIELELTEDGYATLQWSTPTKGVNNGYIDVDALNYTIIRNPDNIIVSENQTETTFSEQLPNTLERYSYSVIAKVGGFESDKSESNSVVYGDGINLPIDVALGESQWFNLCTVFDLDGDGTSFYEIWGSVGCYSAYADEVYSSDDWLISPPVYLEKGNYLFEITYMAAGDGVDAEFTVGNKPFPEYQTTEIGRIENLLYSDGIKTTMAYFNVEETGKHYFGIHFTSETPIPTDISMPYGSFQRMKITGGPDNSAPATVENLKGEPFAMGELKTRLTFVAPTMSFSHTPLTSLTKIEIYNENDELIGSLDEVVPGNTYEFVDEAANQGFNNYNIYAFNANGKGELAQISIYAGQDVPSMISSLNFEITDNRILDFEWGEPGIIGMNGGYADPETLTYDFCRSQYSNQIPFAVSGGTGLTERHFSYTECGVDSYYGTTQHMYYYGIKPINLMGEGLMGYIGLVLGDPYKAPFKESFAGGVNNFVGWSNQLLDGEQAWSVSTNNEEIGIYPSDNDGGMLLFDHENDIQTGQAIISPILELSKMKNPKLAFDLYYNVSASDDAYLSIQGSKNTDSYIPLDLFYINETDENLWKRKEVSLKNFNDNNRVFVAFLGVNSDSHSSFAIDNIEIYDDVDVDLELQSMSGPHKVGLNEEIKFDLVVVAKGLKDVDDYIVDLYADDIKVGSVSGNRLKRNDCAELSISIKPNASNAYKQVKYVAQINLVSDGNEKNNSQTVIVEVGGSLLPQPENLHGEVIGEYINLNWSAPVSSIAEDVVETFEDYEAYAINSQGDWKFVDGDNLLPCGIGGVNYPNMDQARAFMIWNVSTLNISDKVNWTPYSGSQCLIAFASDAYTKDGVYDGTYQSDDWLISEHIVGGTDVSFYASSVANGTTERFEFMVSYRSQNPEDFTCIEGEEVITQKGWKYYKYTLPIDAEYFAIRYVSKGTEAFALMFDDISYTSGYGELELLGYNVYVDEARVNESVLNERAITCVYVEKSIYGVSAVYEQGESEMIELITGSVDNIDALNDVIAYIKDNEIVIENSDNKQIIIYDLLGRIILSEKGTGNNHIKVEKQSVYIVKVGNEIFKFIVK
ncbi:MAG: hypothetical protein E7079_07055 [Bacteroidales bacterium]|nr:hypothetical protein [Bacteroidales bacterium]